MAKGGKSKRDPVQHKPAEKSQIDAAALQAEVKSFASGLGLAAAGIGSGFDDSDFRPPAAGQQSKVKPLKSQKSAEKKSAATRLPQTDKQQAVPGRAEPAAAQQPAETPDVVRERNWNAGVGPRPGLSTVTLSQQCLNDYK